MASEEKSLDIEDMRPAAQKSNYDDDTEWIELDGGESIAGEIRTLNPTAGQYDTGMIQISPAPGELKNLWLNKQVKDQLEAEELGEGSVCGIINTGETASFTTDDDETVEYDIYEVRLP